MPIRATTDDLEFVETVHRLCERGLSEYAIAAEMEMTRYRLNERLRDLGLGIEARRQVVRLGSGEAYPELRERGEIVAADVAVLS